MNENPAQPTSAPAMLRLFIAVDLSAEARAVLRDTQQHLQQQHLAVRWIDPDGAHLTLKFLGSVQHEQIKELTDRLVAIAARHKPFMLHTGALGAFPDLKRSRVAWLTVDGDRAALARMRDDVEDTIAPLGFPPEDRPFSPHLTLGRAHKDATPQQRAAIGRAIALEPAPRAVSFRIEEIVLMRSDLGPSGARYTSLVKAKLSNEH